MPCASRHRVACIGLAFLGPVLVPPTSTAENALTTLQTRERSLYLSAEGGGGGRLTADRTAANVWEQFLIVDRNGGRLRSGDRVLIRTTNGHYVSAEGGGGRELVANRKAGLQWEEFIIEKHASPTDPVIVGPASVSFRTFDSRFWVTAENGGGAGLKAVRTTQQAKGPQELFRIGPFFTPNPERLSAPFENPAAFGKPIGVDRDKRKGPKVSSCTDYRGYTFPHCYDTHMGTDFPLLTSYPGAALGFKVIAAAAGEVLFTDDGHIDKCFFNPFVPDTITCPQTPGEAANYVVIRQDDGRVAFYHHMRRDSILVRKGQRVECGAQLGMAASSGRSALPHLHFELRTAVEAQTDEIIIDKDYEFIRSKTDTVDSYDPMRWSLNASRVPLRTCSESILGCRGGVIGIQCSPATHWAACRNAAFDLKSACALPGLRGCQKTCADVCTQVCM